MRTTPAQQDCEACIRTAIELCAIPAPTFEEAVRADEIYHRLDRLDCTPIRTEVGNVLVRFGGQGSALVVAAHLDTVFAGIDTITPRRDGDRIYAPGIIDNSLGLAGLLVLAEHFQLYPPAVPLVLAATVGEEGRGDLRGARELVQATACHEFIALEGQALDHLVVLGPGSARYDVAIEGPGGHSWMDQGRPSAVHELIRLLTGFLEYHNGVQLNVGTINGGTAASAIAEQALASMEIRSLDEAAIIRATEWLEQYVAHAQSVSSDAITISLEPIGRRHAGVTDSHHPLVQSVFAERERLGLAPPQYRAVATDANAAYAAGVPGISIGIAEGEHLHSLDEYADVSRLAEGLAVLMNVVVARTS